MAVKPIPEGYEGATPYLIVKGAAAAIEFYKKALGAVELFRLPAPGDMVGHAEIKIGSAIVMLADENPDWGNRGPHALGGTPVSLMVYVPDEVDARFQRAIDAGGVVKKPMADQFYGDRSGTFVDPFGHVWALGIHIEDVAPEEMATRMAKMMG